MRLNVLARAGVLGAAVSLAVGLLVDLEGYPGKPYRDVAGILTDCYGNTKNVRADFVRSAEECKALLNGEAERIGAFIYADAPSIPVNTLAATISWTYNVGDGAYRQSTLRKHLRQGRWEEACYQMARWVYITDPRTKRKVVSPGLENRRKKEIAVCLDF